MAPERADTNDDPSGTRSFYAPAYSFTSRGYSYSGKGEIAVEYVNTPFGPPDAQQDASAWATMTDRANALSLLADGTVVETTYDGRPALVVGADVGSVDGGFRRATLHEAAHTFGYRPLAPASLPGRFRFSLTAIQYRAGLLSFTVTARREKGTHDPLLADPFEPGPATGFESREVRMVTLNGGALAGAKAKLATAVSGVPHLWAFHDGLMVTIGGDLTESQLLSAAESLAPLEE